MTLAKARMAALMAGAFGVLAGTGAPAQGLFDDGDGGSLPKL